MYFLLEYYLTKLMQEFPLLIDLQVAADKGEDAHFYQSNKDYFVMAVFDGLGGRSAGYDGLKGGKIASGLARNSMQKFLLQYKLDQEENIIKLQKEICMELKYEADTKIKPSKLKGTLANKRLCTTAAIANISTVPDAEGYYQVNWANMGDSRIYFLSPEKGLQQLTQDDIEVVKNALEMIREDPPMSQFLTADMPTHWQINFNSGKFSKGCFLACTDGCFQYLLTPWHFEKMLLQNLAESESKSDWEILLTTEYESNKQDDVSLIIYPVGFNNFSEIKEAYKQRLEYLQTEFFKNSEFNLDEAKELWKKYQIDYEERLPERVIRKPVTKEPTAIQSIPETSKKDEFSKGKEPLVFAKKPDIYEVSSAVTIEVSARRIDYSSSKGAIDIGNLLYEIEQNYQNPQKVIDVYYQLISILDSIPVQTLTIVSTSLFELKKLEDAEKICWQIINRESQNFYPHYLIGKIKLEQAEQIFRDRNHKMNSYQNRLEEAKHHLNSALKFLNSYSDDTYYKFCQEINKKLDIVTKKLNYRGGY
jgi:serine/threonine protein phosphatase PrpC